MIGAVLGGIGLFLLGMKMLTDGLQALAGDALRDLLRRYTRTPSAAVATGAATTALVQSSSATTLAVIGFVGAGLLTFTQALGVIYGINLGTTSTAWIVSIIGLRVKVEVFALPLVGIGAGLKLLGKGSTQALGTALAGFGLLFFGIGVLQGGMGGLAEGLDPAAWASPGWSGRIALVALGIIMTVVVQSSSVAVAATLTAVDAGTITFEQAAALVVGQNVGTTVKAAIAAMGGSVAVRRTSVAHILFNVVTGLVALALLPLFVAGVSWLSDRMDVQDAAVSIALFHTVFNLVGVLLFLPATERFAALVERLVPERRSPLARRLVDAGSGVPSALLEAARRTVVEVAAVVVGVALQALGEEEDAEAEARLLEARETLRATKVFLEPLRTDPTTPDEFRQHLSILHALDHLHRLAEACDEPSASVLGRESLSRELATSLRRLLEDASSWLGGDPAGPIDEIAARAEAVLEQRQALRPQVLEGTARGELAATRADALLVATRWAERVASHTWRALHHVKATTPGAKPVEVPASEAPELREVS